MGMVASSLDLSDQIANYEQNESPIFLSQRISCTSRMPYLFDEFIKVE